MPDTPYKPQPDIKAEEYRQARAIHGGLLGYFVASAGIRLSRAPIPGPFRRSVYLKVFGTKYPPGLNEAEAEFPLTTYRSLNALFTRGVKPEFRPVPAATSQFLSPCDGTVQEVGRVTEGKVLTLKGIEYTIDSLVPGADNRTFEGSNFAIVFLSPIDCHRVFSPQDVQVEEVIHVPGYRLLVHPPFQRAEFPVYTLNERMIFRLRTRFGPCLLIMVAGWGVGNITLPWDASFKPGPTEWGRNAMSPPKELKPAEWLATFELGSTVVLITPPNDVAKPCVATQQKVKYGQPLFDFPA